MTRMLRVGFETRLTVTTAQGADVSVVLTRTHARALRLVEGATVWLAPADGATSSEPVREVVTAAAPSRAETVPAGAQR